MSEKSATQVKFKRNRGNVAGRQGQALLELTVTTPFLFLLILMAIDFGGWLYAWTEVGNAARAAANYAALGPSSAGSPVTPNGTAITNLIASDLATLPNYSSTNPAVIVCWYNNGTSTSINGTCPAHSAVTDDPEGSSYISVYVDLNYTYTSVFSSYSVLGFGLPSFLTSTQQVHRHVVMRFI